MHHLICAALLLWVCGCTAPSRLPETEYLKNIPSVETLDYTKHDGTITADTSFGRVAATADFRRYNRDRDGGIHHWRGMDGETPAFVLEQINLSVNGRAIPLPADSYKECGEAFFQSSNLLLHDAGGMLGLSYCGGDGAGAHRILFIVDGDRAIEVATFAWRAIPGRKYPVKAWQSEPVSRTAQAEELP